MLSCSEIRGVSEITISGNTYPHRAAIREIGGVWDPAKKVWTIDVAGLGLNTTRGRGDLSYALRCLRGCQVTAE